MYMLCENRTWNTGECAKATYILTITEVGLGPGREDDLAVSLTALGEGKRQGGRAADNLPTETQRAMHQWLNSDRESKNGITRKAMHSALEYADQK